MQKRIVLLFIYIVGSTSLKTTRRETEDDIIAVEEGIDIEQVDWPLQPIAKEVKKPETVIAFSNDFNQNVEQIEKKLAVLKQRIYSHEKMINKLAKAPLSQQLLLNEIASSLLRYQKDHLIEENEMQTLPNEQIYMRSVA